MTHRDGEEQADVVGVKLEDIVDIAADVADGPVDRLEGQALDPWQLRRQVRWTIGHTMLVPGLYQEMDYPDVASLAAPKPILVINGRKDTLFHPEGVQAAFDKLHSCYEKAGAPDHCQTRWYDTPHEFNAEMQAEAWAFLKAHL